MKQWEFKKYLLRRWKILRAGTLMTFRESTTYSFNNWGSLISTVSYMVTWLIFLEAIFGRTQGIAGYSFNQILFFNLVVQVTFMFVWFGSLNNIDKFTEMVRNGDLDTVLTRPLPHLFYISVGKLDIPGMVTNAVVSISPLLWLLLRRGGVTLRLFDLVVGILIVMAGIISVHCFQFVFACQVIKTGQSRNLQKLNYEVSMFGTDIPLEGYPNWFKVIGLVLVPCFLPASVGVSVMLGKLPEIRWLVFSIFMAVYFLLLKDWVWRRMIKQYQSASS